MMADTPIGASGWLGRSSAYSRPSAGAAAAHYTCCNSIRRAHHVVYQQLPAPLRLSAWFSGIIVSGYILQPTSQFQNILNHD